jgi:hypothetical protein
MKDTGFRIEIRCLDVHGNAILLFFTVSQLGSARLLACLHYLPPNEIGANPPTMFAQIEEHSQHTSSMFERLSPEFIQVHLLL